MPKKLITKKIKDLTETDKAQYLAYLKDSFLTNYGEDWSTLEPAIQADIDSIFDDRLFCDFVTFNSLKSPHASPHNSPQQVNNKVKIAMEARKYFNYRKPELVDYLIFGAAFEKGTDEVSWWVKIPSGSTTPADSAATHTSAATSASETASNDSNTSTSSGTAQNASEEKAGKTSGKKSASLSPEEKDLFYNTFFPLLDFINRKYKIAKDTNLLEEQESVSPLVVNDITAKLWENPEKEIGSYMAKKNNLTEEEKELLLGWKNGIVRGRFIIERYLKSGAVFIHMTEKSMGPVFIVKGLSASFEDMFWDKPLPLMIDATLLPFKNIIITDGLFAPYGLIFGKGVRDAFKDVYMKAKKSKTVFTRL